MTVSFLYAALAGLGIALLGANFCLFAASQLLKALSPFAPGAVHSPRAERSAQRVEITAPFVSVHVPCCDEPPEMLARSLQCLARLDYPNYEVVVLDNNTPDADTWRPIADLCGRLGPRFRFFHFDRVAGAKAGALNLCLKQTDRRASYAAIVDADYQVTPDFLSRAVEILQRTTASFVQFPQAFRDVAAGGEAVALELEDYFSVLARQRPALRSPLLTGTLSVISMAALKRSGGWSASSVTEDAELGLRLHAIGERGVFVDEIMGRGLLPTSLRGLKSQRRRWISGNMQTLTHAIRSGVLTQRPGARSILAQLSAWPAFWLAPILTLVLTSWLADDAPWIACLHALAAGTILSATAFAVMRGVLIRNRSVAFLRGVAGPLAVKLALLWISSSAWLEPMLGRNIAFVKTSKSAVATGSTGANAWLSLMSIAACLLYLGRGNTPAAIACFLASLSWPAAIWVDRGLRRYGAVSAGSDGAPSALRLLPCTA